MIMQKLTPMLILFALVCQCATQGTAQGQAKVVSARAGLVTKVEGEAYYRPGGGNEIKQLQTGTKLEDGDTVLTVSNGRAEWTLNPDSYLQVGADSYVRIYETSFERMHFDIERGEVFVIVRSLERGASLVIHTPPGLLTVYKPGRYRFRIAANGETEAAVGKGELRYVDNQGKQVSVKKRRRVNFYQVEKKSLYEM
jgi:hypothetical protein